MTRSIFYKYAWPFIQWFTLMIIITILIDYLLHQFQILYIGRFLGYAGTFVIIFSFVYSLRKRKIIKTGSPKGLLLLHEYMAWSGSIMILVHAGIHFNAFLPWLAVFMMTVAVASGLVGKFLLKKANTAYKDKLQALMKTGITKDKAERKLFFDTITVDIMKKWRVVHLPITLLFGALSLLHIITVFLFKR